MDTHNNINNTNNTFSANNMHENTEPPMFPLSTPPTLPAATGLWLQRAVAHHQAGHLAEAEALYRQILGETPNHPDALHLLGHVLRQKGLCGDAEDLMAQAIQAKPGEATYRNSLGIVLKSQGRLDEAIDCYRLALSLRPEFADAHVNLGNALLAQGRPGEAIEHCRHAVRLRPDFAEAHNNLGNALQALQQPGEAAACYQQAIRIKPDYAEAFYNLGGALQALGKPEQAVAAYQAALAIRPAYAEACCNLGAALQSLGLLEQAIETCRRAVALQPEYADAYYNLGNACQAQGMLDEALAGYQAALTHRPDHPATLNNIGGVLQQQGKLAESVARYRQALVCKPDMAEAHSNLIFTQDMDARIDTATQQAERRGWNAAHGGGAIFEIPAHFANAPDPQRRLRIGYVSADFRQHSAPVVFGALLTNFDAQDYEIYAYSNSSKEDAQTQIFRQSVSHWRKIADQTDDAVAEQIRQDRIDILVDLSGHSAGNRLPVFARKPAPIQITAWGYVGGTGMKAMDVFFADPVVVPPEDRLHYTEEVRDLPNFVSAWFPKPFPEINPLPAQNAESVTFGSFNRLCKVSEEAYRTWAKVLQAVPGSRMIVKTGDLNDGGTRTRVLDNFVRVGIDPARILLLGGTDWHEHQAAFNRVDISLDPFPHGGGVTTLEGLMMGVPVVTLRWPTIYGRLSASILTTLGLTDWIAETAEQYVGIAVEKAGDLKALAELRRTLRPRFKASVIGDTAAYARAVEGEYRKLWRAWCGRQRNA